jgi:hypothetical protein
MIEIQTPLFVIMVVFGVIGVISTFRWFCFPRQKVKGLSLKHVNNKDAILAGALTRTSHRDHRNGC